jgi:hypothetical protein
MRTKSGALGSRQGSGPTAAQIASAGAVGVLGALGIRALVARRPSVQLLSDKDALVRVQSILVDLQALKPLTVGASELAEISVRLDDVSKRSVVTRNDFVANETTDQLTLAYNNTRELLNVFRWFISDAKVESPENEKVTMIIICHLADRILELVQKLSSDAYRGLLFYEAKNRVTKASEHVKEMNEKVALLTSHLNSTFTEPGDDCLPKAFQALAAAQVTLSLCRLTRDDAERVLKTFDDKLSKLNMQSISIENHALVVKLKMQFYALVETLPLSQSSNCDNNRVKQSLEARVTARLKK